MNRRQLTKKVLLGVSLTAVFFVGRPADAASFFFSPDVVSLSPGSDVAVGVFLNSQGQDVNAIEGDVVYPPDLLDARGVSDGNSIVNVWIAPPGVAVSGTVRFSGVVPGGWEGNRGKIISVLFKVKAEGKGGLTFENAAALLNDGQGSPARLTISTAALAFSSSFPSSTESVAADLTPPETFAPQVSRDPSVFDGRYFLVFATTDKGSGIDHYEVMEVPGPGEAPASWQRETSPYLLKDQTLSSDIYVRAVDRAGNFVVARVPAENRGRPAEAAGTAFFLVLFLVFFVASLVFLVRRGIKKRSSGG